MHVIEPDFTAVSQVETVVRAQEDTLVPDGEVWLQRVVDSVLEVQKVVHEDKRLYVELTKHVDPGEHASEVVLFVIEGNVVDNQMVYNLDGESIENGVHEDDVRAHIMVQDTIAVILGREFVRVFDAF
ncbi:hypothetical protein [Ralstonia solanacearum]|uniref:hypothetical protein n=1 Tax=Ralstonia solanacearum TaxID=305 RepID=UPI000A0F442C|nr:hypothetical protein [Ralstonia solanacearum]